jgi:hypothetical protein
MSADDKSQDPAEPREPETRPERRRWDYAAAAARGLCPICQKRPPAEQRKWCRACLDAHAARRVTRRKEQGLPLMKPGRKRKPRGVMPVAVAQPADPTKPVTVSSVFEPFAAQLRAIDWRDPVKREAEVGAIFGQMFVAVALAPSLTDADRERLQWLQSLARQMVAFRDASAIEAARRKLTGEDEPKPEDVDGPQLEPTIVVASGPDNSEADGERARQTFRGRPRTRAFS